MSLTTMNLAGAAGAVPPGIRVARTATTFWMSGATAIPLYHMHPHIEEECILPDDIREQTRRVLATFDEVLAFNGLGWGDVAKSAIFLTDLRDHDTVLDAVAEHLGERQPATTVVGINALSAAGARIEIEIVAAVPSDGGEGDAIAPVAAPSGGAGAAVLAPSGSGLVFLSDIRADSPVPAVDGNPAGIDEQATLAVDALERVLEGSGLTLRNVAKVLVSLVDLRELDAVRRVLDARLDGWAPAITAVQVDNLPSPGARVQFDVIATG